MMVQEIKNGNLSLFLDPPFELKVKLEETTFLVVCEELNIGYRDNELDQAIVGVNKQIYEIWEFAISEKFTPSPLLQLIRSRGFESNLDREHQK